MADTYLPRALKNANHVSKLNPLNSLEKSSRASLASRVNAERVLARKTKRTQQARAEVKTQNNRTYQAENKTELAEKMRVKRAKEKFGDRYNSYLASLESMKKLK